MPRVDNPGRRLRYFSEEDRIVMLLYLAVWIGQYWPIIFALAGLYLGVCLAAMIAGVYFS